MNEAPQDFEQHCTAFISTMRGVGAIVTVVATNGKAGRRWAAVSAFRSVSADSLKFWCA